ncbi:MAG: pyruvate kinase [Saprospiraceae bacterium]|nr:pyruvate kinase [Candidatus Vicinibacter proximus]MCC6842664.1 pyruvate kinase [Saprospiraceae bacterium]
MKVGLNSVIKKLEEIDQKMASTEFQYQNLIKDLNPSNQKNARNFLHYLALRSMDIREIQNQLHSLGLSSMASAESHIRRQLHAILNILGGSKMDGLPLYDATSAQKSLHEKTVQLFCKNNEQHTPYIMVTCDTEIGLDHEKTKKLLLAGMNVARINCAHDNKKIWNNMIQNIKSASSETGIPCKIYMDLAGPKIRTVFKSKSKLKIEEGCRIRLVDESRIKDQKDTVGCTVPDIHKRLKPGEPVLFDDGTIETTVEKISKGFVFLRVKRISAKKKQIKAEKGINFPNSKLNMPALTEFDIKCLPFIKRHADMVGYSFVQSAADLMQLQQLLPHNEKLAIILKIETAEAVLNLPSLLLTGLKQQKLGVMIARGDLAVEIGFERMSEIQEEILWLCEAAHVPVIWATQVLDNLNKLGMATRSEITDAAHAVQAECVMINKGPHTIQTIETLRNILDRSGGHHAKKRHIFRLLNIASNFLDLNFTNDAI